MPRLLLTAPRSSRKLYFPDEAVAALRALGEVILNENDRPWTLAELIDRARGCEVIVSDRQTPGPAELFEQVPDLISFVRTAVDISTVDVAAASTHGILVTRASPGFANAVSELILGYMIDLARGITDSTLAYRSGQTPGIFMGRQLEGSVLGVIGYGAIGRRLCELGRALGMELVVADPYVETLEAGIERTSLIELLRRADFVVCLAVANAETENLMDADAFAAMKEGACFINAARGDLVDEDALITALETGRLGGAALDVGRAPDQMPSPVLAAHPRVIATPHIGGLTPRAVAHQALESARQCAAILRGEVPAGAVNADRATRLTARSGVGES